MPRDAALQKIMESFIAGDFTKVAQDMGAPMPVGAPMDPMMQQQMMPPPPPMDPSLMMPPQGAYADPALMGQMPPPPPPPEVVGKSNENDVAMKALDLAAKVIAANAEGGEVAPEDASDQAAAALAGSKALENIPPEQIIALLEQPGNTGGTIENQPSL